MNFCAQLNNTVIVSDNKKTLKNRDNKKTVKNYLKNY